MRNVSQGNPLLVIVGMCGSGKSTIAKYLSEIGWQVIRFGDITIEELLKRGLEVCEENEKRIREEIREQYGKDAYARLLLPKIKEALTHGQTAIDGLYSWSEYKVLLSNIDSRVITVCAFANRSIRYKRLGERVVRPLSLEEAEKRDIAEIENLEKGGPIAITDYLLINNESETKLCSDIGEFLETLSLGKSESPIQD